MAAQLRDVVSQACADFHRIHLDPDLNTDAKRRKREEVVARVTDRLEQLTSVERARASVLLQACQQRCRGGAACRDSPACRQPQASRMHAVLGTSWR
jgi:hypothetical protein